jgi:hypothetical protein
MPNQTSLKKHLKASVSLVALPACLAATSAPAFAQADDEIIVTATA